MVQDLKIPTRNRIEMLDITEKVRSSLFSSGIKTGICQVFTVHTTAGITINENADPDVRTDYLEALNKIVPLKNNYHHDEGNSAAHIKASLTGSSVTIPVKEGRLVLGIWQGIYLCEFDGPRSRTVIINSIGQ
jgi:secondary thiamine-phosphate synthase enzyme